MSYGNLFFLHLSAYSFVVSMKWAGTPPQTSPGGTDLVTTLPAATIELGPISTPGNIVARIPIKQLSRITTGANLKTSLYSSVSRNKNVAAS